MRVHFPETTEAALRLLDTHGENAKVMAGGTALMIMLRSGLVMVDEVVALERLAGLGDVQSVSPTSIRLGARLTLRDVAASREIRDTFPALSQALPYVANHRVRSRATVGGNLAESDYASDPPAILSAYGCRVRLQSTRGERWLPLSDFLVGYYETALEPGELLTDIEVDRPPRRSSGMYLKYNSRSAEDRPCVGVMALVETDESQRVARLRIAIAGATATPFTMPDVERDIAGSKLDEAAVAAIANEYGQGLQPLDDQRGSAEYRKNVTQALVGRALRYAVTGISGAKKL